MCAKESEYQAALRKAEWFIRDGTTSQLALIFISKDRLAEKVIASESNARDAKGCGTQLTKWISGVRTFLKSGEAAQWNAAAWEDWIADQLDQLEQALKHVPSI